MMKFRLLPRKISPERFGKVDSLSYF